MLCTVFLWNASRVRDNYNLVESLNMINQIYRPAYVILYPMLMNLYLILYYFTADNEQLCGEKMESKKDIF